MAFTLKVTFSGMMTFVPDSGSKGGFLALMVGTHGHDGHGHLAHLPYLELRCRNLPSKAHCAHYSATGDGDWLRLSLEKRYDVVLEVGAGSKPEIDSARQGQYVGQQFVTNVLRMSDLLNAATARVKPELLEQDLSQDPTSVSWLASRVRIAGGKLGPEVLGSQFHREVKFIDGDGVLVHKQRTTSAHELTLRVAASQLDVTLKRLDGSGALPTLTLKPTNGMLHVRLVNEPTIADFCALSSDELKMAHFEDVYCHCRGSVPPSPPLPRFSASDPVQYPGLKQWCDDAVGNGQGGRYAVICYAPIMPEEELSW